MNKRLFFFVLVVGLCIISRSVSAHHGTGISYDESKKVTLNGTVTRFAFTNPHSQLYFDVKDDKGVITHWAAELNAPGVLTTGGWTRRTIKPGDEITVTVNPSKSGAPVGNAVRSMPIICNGKPLALGGRAID